MSYKFSLPEYKHTRFLLFISTLLLMLIFQTITNAQQNDDRDKDNEEKLSKAAMATAEARKQLIDAEIKQLVDHEWAGEYHYGDGLGVNVSLTLAPSAGFVFNWYGCMGLYDLNYGSVSYGDGIVRLKFQYANDNKKSFQGIAPEFYLVHWGERHYLIPTDKVISFCNAVNCGSEPVRQIGSSFLLRATDKDKQVTGKPGVPVQYREYLLEKPLKTSITAIQDTKVKIDKDINFQTKLTRATFDIGHAEGVRKGMEFYDHEQTNYSATAHVVAVHEHTCEVVIEQLGDEQYNPTPQIKWQFSTTYR